MAQRPDDSPKDGMSLEAGIGLDFFLLQRTGSALAMSVNVILSIVPALVFGPAAGLLLDRADRRRVLVWADILRGVLTLGLGWVIYAGRFSIIHSYCWTVVLSLIRVLYDPGTMALLPALVPPGHLQRANALQASGRNVAGIIGPALAGLTVASLGPWFALAADAASFGMSALFISFAHARFEERPVKTGRPRMSELKEGLGFFREVRLASTLLAITVIVNACSQPSGIALNFHVLKTLGGSPAFLGVIGSVSAGASLLASFLVATRKRWPHLGRMIALAMGGIGLSYVLASAAPTIELLPIAFALAGFMGPLLQIPVQTLYQDITPSEIRGRVFALRMALSQILSPVSFAVSGVLLDAFGSIVVFAGLGVILLSACAWRYGTSDLSLKEIPVLFRRYRPTYHIGGIRPLASHGDEDQLEGPPEQDPGPPRS